MDQNHFFRTCILPVLFTVIFTGCRNPEKSPDAQQIIDSAIAVSGGELYKQSKFRFVFRDKEYIQEQRAGKRVMKRIQQTDSGKVTDIKAGNEFERYFEEELLSVSDSMANVYSSSINSVHYFAYLPYGLNDPAVNKEWIGEKQIKGKTYHQIRVTFDQQGGGEDFEDVYLYWIDKETFKPEYLAYEFHVNGGGLRFREAYNERYINGIRFVDYRNYKPKGDVDITKLDALFENGKLDLVSDIRLEDIEVNRDSYN